MTAPRARRAAPKKSRATVVALAAAAAGMLSEDTIADEANLAAHRRANYLAESIVRAFGGEVHIVREIQRAIENADEKVKDALRRLDSERLTDQIKEQPYGKAYIACVRREIKRLKAFIKAAKVFMPSAEIFAEDFQKEHASGDDSIGTLVMNRVVFGEGGKPTNHATLVRGMAVGNCWEYGKLFRRYSELWGLVGGWRWSANHKSERNPKEFAVRRTISVCNAFLAADGKRHRGILIYSGAEGKKEGELNPLLAGLLSDAEIEVVRLWADDGRPSRARRGTKIARAPSEALTAKIAAALNIIPSEVKE